MDSKVDTRNHGVAHRHFRDPTICHGKACIAGTRIMVSVVLDNLAAGESPGDHLAPLSHAARGGCHPQLWPMLPSWRANVCAHQCGVKFKLVENLSPTLSALFVAVGHEAHSVIEQLLSGQPDERVIDVCRREQRALVRWTWISPTS